MQTRRDHLQAYQFAVDRLSTALVSGDPGRGESPTRRAALGTFFGMGVVLLLCAGFAVYGLVAPVPDHSWRASGSYIVEKETGNRYLLLDGALHPVRNYASLLLLTRSPSAHTVSRQDLSGIPHGAAVGIPGAPDEVPTPGLVLGGDWTRCLRPRMKNGQSVDFAPQGRTTDFPTDGQALLAASDGSRYLLWRGTKYPVPAQATLVALGLDADRQIAAPDNWLDALPTGRPLTAVVPAGRGRKAGEVSGHAITVGQLFTTETGGERHYYVMTADGIARTTATESALLAAEPGSRPPLDVPSFALAALPTDDDPALAGSLPDVAGAPAVSVSGRAVCLEQRTDGAALSTRVVLEGGEAATGSREVVVPPAHGAVVRSREDVLKKANHPRTYLVTDDGTAYRLADDDVTSALGLSGSTSLLPDTVIGLLPTGPALSMPGSGTGGEAGA